MGGLGRIAENRSTRRREVQSAKHELVGQKESSNASLFLAIVARRFHNLIEQSDCQKIMFALHKTRIDDVQAYEAALERALDDLLRAQQAAAKAREELQAADARVLELRQLAKSLLSILPEERATKYATLFDQTSEKSPSGGRAGPVYDNVINLFSVTSQRRWSASEVQAALSSEGRGADAKSVLNVLNYLVRKGRLKRISRGHYYVVDLGIGVQLDGDIPGMDDGGCP